MATATATSTALPSGYHAPLALVTDNSHGAWVVICSAFGLLVALITLGIRVYIRRKVSPPFAGDDWSLTASCVLALIQAALVFGEVHEGFGKSLKLISESKVIEVQKLGYAADIFYILTLYASKCSVIFLFKRISADRLHSLAAWAVLSVCSVLGVVSIFLVALRCNLSQPWVQYGAQCSSLGAQWAAVTAFDIFTEVALFGMAIHLVWALQIDFRRKTKVVFAFGLRLPVIAIAALRIHYIYRYLSSSDPTLYGAIPAVITQLEIYYSILSATIPCLRPFLAGFVTNYGAMGGETVIGGSHIGTSSRNGAMKSKGSFAMTSMLSTGRDATSRKHEKSAMRSTNRDVMDEGMFRPDQGHNESNVTHNAPRRGHDASSISSNESTKMIIKKEVQYQVDSESRDRPYDLEHNRR